MYLRVKPAYGRDYKNQTEVKKAWGENKDFQIASDFYHGSYVNKSDAEREGVHVIVYYDRGKKSLQVC